MNAKPLYLCFLLLISRPASGQLLLSPEAQEVLFKVPPVVPKLLVWPAPDVIAAKSVTMVRTNVAGAAYLYAVTWNRITIDSKWLPTNFTPLCIAAEFEGRDVMRFQWTNGGYSFRIAQTASVFAMQVKPAPAVRLEAIRELALDVFLKTDPRMTGQRVAVPMTELNHVIAEASFDPQRIRQMSLPESKTPVLVGRPITIEEAGLVPPGGIIELKEQDRADNVPWHKTSAAWAYWFRNVHWYADETQVVFYFLKEENGATGLSYFGGLIDSTWFKPKFRGAKKSAETRPSPASIPLTNSVN